MIPNIESSKIVFLFGAGASVPAGVPDTYSFVEEYVQSIDDPNKRKTVDRIIEILVNWKDGNKVDIEMLLETLTKLQNKEDDPLLPFFEINRFVLEGHVDHLIDNLRDFIKEKAIVREDKIKYLEPLIQLREEFGPLNIISMNYDICIEQFCNVYKLNCQDGFDVGWEPNNFLNKHVDIRLYKLHGSVMWYKSDRGSYIKVPVDTKESKIKLITGEEAQNLMLYPTQKLDYTEPLLELSVIAKFLLQSEKCKYIIVVGYSFRDEHILRMIWDAARRNKNLHIILIDPNASQIYANKLQYYDSITRIPSTLDGRVICLPYYFHEMFLYLRWSYLHELENAFAEEKEMHQKEIEGQIQDWLKCAMSFSKGEYAQKAIQFIERIDEKEDDYPLVALQYYFQLFLNLELCENKKAAQEYRDKFIALLRKILIDRLDLETNQLPQNIFLKFNAHPQPNSHRFKYPSQFIEDLEKWSSYLQMRLSFACKRPPGILAIKSGIDDLASNFKCVENSSWENYKIIRKGKLVHSERELHDPQALIANRPHPDDYDYLKETIINTERKLLEDIFYKYFQSEIH